MCPGHNSSLQYWIWITHVFHTIFVHDTRVCHDLDPKLYLQGQGHSVHIQCTGTKTLCPGHNSLMSYWILIIFHTIVVTDPRVYCTCIYMYLQGQGHSANIPKLFFRAITPYNVKLDIDYISHNCCPWPKNTTTLTLGHISKVKVTVHTKQISLSNP